MLRPGLQTALVWGSSHDAVEATRSVVLVAGVEQLGFWSDLLTGPDADHDTIVLLRRQDLRSLKDWTLSHSLCEAEERLTRLAGRPVAGPTCWTRRCSCVISDRTGTGCLRT
ncbi:hypothetical protein [Streptomyces rubrogriseus]|uniref:hypothetical protein n=1 Tax=Streptomyces rubrogriseus TaxID=194673 RepID=UPI00379C75CD